MIIVLDNILLDSYRINLQSVQLDVLIETQDRAEKHLTSGMHLLFDEYYDHLKRPKLSIGLKGGLPLIYRLVEFGSALVSAHESKGYLSFLKEFYGTIGRVSENHMQLYGEFSLDNLMQVTIEPYLD